MATIPEVSSVTVMVLGIVGLICWQSRLVMNASMLVPTVERSHAILMLWAYLPNTHLWTFSL